MYIAIFKEFRCVGILEEFCKEYRCPLRQASDYITYSDTIENNIKIFFDEKTKDKAYELKDALEKAEIAKFITDQLTLKEKNGNIIYLPKDRIIMRCIIGK